MQAQQSSLQHDQQPRTAASTSRKRKSEAVAETGVNHPVKKRQTNRHKTIDRAMTLSLAHLLHDRPADPLYPRHADLLLDCVDVDEKIRFSVAEPLHQLASELRGRGTDERFYAGLEQLTASLTKRVLRQVASVVVEAYDLGTSGKSMVLEEQVNKFKFKLHITPIVELDDDQESQSAREHRRKKTREVRRDEAGTRNASTHSLKKQKAARDARTAPRTAAK